jgi:hypothetical protein
MAEKITAELEVKTNAGEAAEEIKDLGDQSEESAKKASSLKAQIRETVVAMQKLEQQGKATGKEYEDLRQKLDDLNDTQDRAKFKAGQFEDRLASLPGPLGQLGGGLKTVGDSFATFGKTLTISLGIFGLIVAAFIGIKEALGKTKEGTQALSAVTTALNKVMAPFFALLEKVGLAVLPIVTKGFEVLGSVMSKVAQFFGATPAKIDEVTASLEKNNEYANTLAEAEKKRLEDAKKQREEKEAADKKAFDARIARMQSLDKLEDAQIEKEKARELARAKTEQQKLYVEEKFAKLTFEKKKKDLEDLRKQYGKETNEYRDYTAQILTLQGTYETQKAGFRDRQLAINKEKRKEEFEEIKLELEKQFNEGTIKEEEYQNKLLVLREQYAETNLEKLQIASDRAKIITDRRKKDEAEGRQITFQQIQDEINAIDLLNAAQERDYQDDITRLEEKKALLLQQRDIELTAAKDDAVKQLEIKRNYAKSIGEVEKEITNTQKAELEARAELQMAYANAVGAAGKFLQQIAGENKGLAIAGIVLEQAAAIASIAVNASKNFVKDGGVTSPLAWVNLAAAGIQAASAVMAAKKGIDAINAVKIPGGESGGGSAGSVGTPPTYSGPRGMAAPSVQGGMTTSSPTSQIAQTIGTAQAKPLKAYVLTNDVSSAQALQRRTNNAATFGG